MADTKHEEPTQLYPAPGPSYRFEVNGTSNYPIQDMDYRIDLYDKTIFMVYQNAAFDCIALVMAKLGHIFGEYDVTGDLGKTQRDTQALMNSLNAEVIGG